MKDATPDRIWICNETGARPSSGWDPTQPSRTEYIRADIHERAQSIADFLSREQGPVQRRYFEANARAKKAQLAARKMVDDLGLLSHTRTSWPPGSWQHDLAAIAGGEWDAVPEGEGDG